MDCCQSIRAAVSSSDVKRSAPITLTYHDVIFNSPPLTVTRMMLFLNKIDQFLLVSSAVVGLVWAGLGHHLEP